jgi:hypothetical protein
LLRSSPERSKKKRDIIRHFLVDGIILKDEPLPDWFWDHYDADIMGIPVTEIAGVSFRRRFEAREYHQAKRESVAQLAKRHKYQGVHPVSL